MTHRIVEVGTDAQGASRLRTKGDANPAVDPWTFSLVATEQPVVQFSVPKVGYLFIALADRDTRILVIGVPAGIIALLALVEPRQERRGVHDHPRRRRRAHHVANRGVVGEILWTSRRDPLRSV